LGAAAARLPIFRVFRASLLVIPFVGLFSLIVYLSGDVHRAWFILGKSYLSALSVLVCISATPMAQLLRAAQFFRIPGLLLEVTQMIYRYLFVLSAQAHAMQTAFRSRGGRSGTRALRASSAMIAVLFTKSYAKATMIHQAMLGRGFTGSLPGSEFRSLRIQELAIVSAGLVVAIALHFV
jgi:cobalt/nickel transport system permease protein